MADLTPAPCPAGPRFQQRKKSKCSMRVQLSLSVDVGWQGALPSARGQNRLGALPTRKVEADFAHPTTSRLAIGRSL
jgi:hypothetical protein